ncbi:uncharacterized protein LOC141705630 [Apium graveolens]|uniref:uncharacterized protein LOC141705630 n=1 Tax=Apium graveolens TaxID=4045 RepID=UPI003D7A9E5C
MIKAILDMEHPRSVKDIQKHNEMITALGRFISMSGDKCQPFFKSLKKVKDFSWTDECQMSFKELKKYKVQAPLLAKLVQNETLYLYLVVFERALSVVLVKKEAKTHKHIKYVNKILHAAELNYLTIVKFALALVMTLRKLRPYFEAHKIEVLKNKPLRNIIHSSKVSGRLIKWAIELEEFDIKYKPRTSIIAQTDFVVEYFPTTNNEAEYEAHIAGLGLAGTLRVKNLKVCGDSKLVVSHVNGEFEARDDTMAIYVRLVRAVMT